MSQSSSFNKNAAEFLKNLTPAVPAKVVEEIERRFRQNEKTESSALFEPSQKGQDGYFDEKLYIEAKLLFQAAITNLADAGTEVKDFMRATIRAVTIEFGESTAANRKPYVVRFVADYRKT